MHLHSDNLTAALILFDLQWSISINLLYTAIYGYHFRYLFIWKVFSLFLLLSPMYIEDYYVIKRWHVDAENFFAVVAHKTDYLTKYKRDTSIKFLILCIWWIHRMYNPHLWNFIIKKVLFCFCFEKPKKCFQF